ncbi:MAG: TonB-dependent receptor [Bacteroidales bacterium]|nr:TonB-dependent receptor [Bacteroidales bacterium]
MRKHHYLTMLLLAGLPLVGAPAAYALPEPQQQGQAETVINGTVLDENDEPVIGASVVQKGNKTNAVATDAFGHFKIRVAAGAQLEISYVGYQTMTMKAAPDMIAYMQPTTEMLNELVAIGYGSQKKANLTGAVATVDVARTMESRPVADVTKALQGSVPGLTITSTSGDINSSSAIRIRGVGSLTNGRSSDPLIVVDGVPVDNLNFIDPNDIADISVLKDAASAAVYGARASFGVILITTKSADKKDKVSVNYSANFSWATPTVLPNFVRSYEDAEASMQAYYSGNGASNKSVVGDMFYDEMIPYFQKWYEQHGDRYSSIVALQPYQDENNIGDYRIVDGKFIRYADWDMKNTVYQWAPQQKHNVSLEGTSGKTNYRLSFGYDGRENMMRYVPEKLSQYMANANISTEITNWLKAGTRISFTQRDYEEPNTPNNTLQYAMRWAPFVSTWGTIADPETGEDRYFRNTLSERILAPIDKTRTRQTRIQAWMNAEIIKGLTLQADFTYDFRSADTKASWKVQETWDWGSKPWAVYTWPTTGQDGTLVRARKNDMDRWTTNVFATYAKTFAQKHNLKVMGGFSAERYTYDNLYAQHKGRYDLDLIDLNLTYGSEASDFTITGGSGHSATAGFFGRVNYDYNGIYLFEANVRYDGSTRFPANKQWAVFPSFSAGWRFSEENFFKPLSSWWSNGKLRASYGHLGNENVGTNVFISTITPGNKNVSWLNSSATQLNGATMPTLVNSSLTWERVVTTDVGLDLGFLNNSLNVTFDWFNRETKDMLAPGMPVPSTLGASAPTENAGTLRTNGWELSVNYNKSFGDWNMWATVTLGDAKSKVTKWANNESLTLYSYYFGESGYRFYEGQTYGDIWGFEVDRFFEKSDFSGQDENGIWQYAPGVANQEQLRTGSFHFGPGDIKYKDLDGDGTISNGDPNMVDAEGNAIPVGTLHNHGDLKVIGNALPRYEYSFRLGASWKGFDLDLFFQGVGKRAMWVVSNSVQPFAQSNSGLFEHQTSYNKVVVDGDGKIIDYIIDQDNLYPRLTTGDMGYMSNMRNTCNQGWNNYVNNDRYIVNMAYLRMKNITFGYTLPYDITKKAYIQKARIYFSAENPFFVYNGAGKFKLDPEVHGGVSEGLYGFGRNHPTMKSYSFGLQVSF